MATTKRKPVSPRKSVPDTWVTTTWEQYQEAVRARLDAKRGIWRDVARDAKVGYRWMRGFAAKVPKSANIEMVFRLGRAVGVEGMIAAKIVD